MLANMSIVIALARILLGLLLIVTGALKVGHASDLATAIAGFRLLPGIVVAPMALVLPFLELMLGLYLVLGLFTRTTALLAAAQFLVYAAAIASAIVRDIPANCGCFGPNDVATADWPHVAFDLTLAAVAAFIAYGAPGALALDRRLNS